MGLQEGILVYLCELDNSENENTTFEKLAAFAHCVVVCFSFMCHERRIVHCTNIYMSRSMNAYTIQELLENTCNYLFTFLFPCTDL